IRPGRRAAQRSGSSADHGRPWGPGAASPGRGTPARAWRTLPPGRGRSRGGPGAGRRGLPASVDDIDPAGLAGAPGSAARGDFAGAGPNGAAARGAGKEIALERRAESPHNARTPHIDVERCHPGGSPTMRMRANGEPESTPAARVDRATAGRGVLRRAGKARIGRAAALAGLALAAALPGTRLAAQNVPTPASHFGYELGTDRKLANWTELLGYYEQLARTSPRVKLDALGMTTKGLPFVMLTITSPKNHARLEEFREMNQKLADPRRISGEEELRRLLTEGRTVVLITHQIHSTEVGGGQMAARMAYRLASSNDPKVLEILENVILLQIPSLNPDGTQWVSDWYRKVVGTEYEAGPMPWLYHFYVGHDNNRDWYAFTQVETQLTVTKAHNVWRPHIVHDIHQMGATGARIFVPPFV